MPRISVKLIQEREVFTNANFVAGMTLEQANNALVERYKIILDIPFDKRYT